MQYLFEDGNEFPVILPPHGNAKRSSTSHRRTQSSTLRMIKESKAKPKIVVSEVYKEMGGSIEAGSASELPRSRWRCITLDNSHLLAMQRTPQHQEAHNLTLCLS